MITRRTLIAALPALLTTPTALADPFRPRMFTGRKVAPPPQWVEFVASTEPLVDRGRTPTFADLVEMNKLVNGAITWGKSPDDPWGRGIEGNCVTAMLQKRMLLATTHGARLDLLRPTLCLAQDRNGLFQGHAVLTVTMPDGDYVLCNLDRAVQVWHRFPYHWDSRLAANGVDWEAVFTVNA